jgi:hypothetical protein
MCSVAAGDAAESKTTRSSNPHAARPASASTSSSSGLGFAELSVTSHTRIPSRDKGPFPSGAGALGSGGGLGSGCEGITAPAARKQLYRIYRLDVQYV